MSEPRHSFSDSRALSVGQTLHVGCRQTGKPAARWSRRTPCATPTWPRPRSCGPIALPATPAASLGSLGTQNRRSTLPRLGPPALWEGFVPKIGGQPFPEFARLAAARASHRVALEQRLRRCGVGPASAPPSWRTHGDVTRARFRLPLSGPVRPNAGPTVVILDAMDDGTSREERRPR